MSSRVYEFSCLLFNFKGNNFLLEFARNNKITGFFAVHARILHRTVAPVALNQVEWHTLSTMLAWLAVTAIESFTSCTVETVVTPYTLVPRLVVFVVALAVVGAHARQLLGARLEKLTVLTVVARWEIVGFAITVISALRNINVGLIFSGLR